MSVYLCFVLQRIQARKKRKQGRVAHLVVSATEEAEKGSSSESLEFKDSLDSEEGQEFRNRLSCLVSCRPA